MVKYSYIGHFLLISLFVLAVSAPARADFFTFHTTNIQFLKGWDYKLGDENREIITLEHANAWKYGDFYGFADFTLDDGGRRNAYTELSPRFSLSKISGADLSAGIIKDVLISTTLEKGKNDVKAYLYGGAVDLDLPGFNYFKTNLYRRDNPEKAGKTWQVTLAWQTPLSFAGHDFICEGFADFAGREGPRYIANQLIVPRFLWDMGKAATLPDKRLYAGVEWQYWHNKFGVRGKTESVPQLQIKWVLY